MKSRSLPILTGALGVTLAFTTLILADEPERKERPQVEQARREAEVQREGESRRPEGPREGREGEAFRPRANEAEQLRARLQELVASGHKEEAEQVKRRLIEMEARAGEPQNRPFSPGGEPEDVERRIKHLTVAAENLHAAGNHELAENLQRQVEQMRRHTQEPRGSGLPNPRQPGFNKPGFDQPGRGQPGLDQPGPGHPGLGQPEPGQTRPSQPGRGQPGVDSRTEELHATVRRLNSELQELREQVQELRKRAEPRKK